MLEGDGAFDVAQQPFGRIRNGQFAGVDDELGLQRRLVFPGDARKVRQRAGSRTPVLSLRIARFAQRGIGFDEDFVKDGTGSVSSSLAIAAIAIVPASAKSVATSPTRRTFSRRSSAENPRSLQSPARTLSPSSTYALNPSSNRRRSTCIASVDFPEAGRPVSQMTAPRCPLRHARADESSRCPAGTRSCVSRAGAEFKAARIVPPPTMSSPSIRMKRASAGCARASSTDKT
jgi:hypothetical protein